MSRTGKRSIPNGFLALIVLVIFVSGIATMLVSGHNLNVNNNSEKSSDVESSDSASDTPTSNPSQSVEPNAFVEESNLPSDYRLISVLNEDIHKGPLILVNYKNESRIDGENLVNIYDNASSSIGVKNDDMFINKIVMDHINVFFDAFKDAKGSTSILISSSYRSKSDQEQIYAESVEATGAESTAYYVSVPGYSEHQTGYCFDTACYNNYDEMVELDGEGVYSWLSENCADYGFILRYPADKTNITSIGYESWHFRYVGTPHSYFIGDNNLCLEEYITGIQQYTFDNGGLLIDKGDKGKWIVYYVPKLEAFNTTEIPVPVDSEKCNYTVSGDNVGGFIVTVDVSKDSNNSLLEKASKNKWSFDNSSLIIEGFKDYDPTEVVEEDSDDSTDSDEEDTDTTDDWESDPFWGEEDESQFEYVDYYDDYDADYSNDDSYEDEDYTEDSGDSNE